MPNIKKPFIHIVAPFRSHMSIDRPLMAMHKKDFNDFVHSIEENISKKSGEFSNCIQKGVEVSVNLGASNTSLEEHYDILNSNGTECRAAHLLDFNFNDKTKSTCEKLFAKACKIADEKCGTKYSQVLTPEFATLNVKSYDLTISICSFDLIVDEKHKFCADKNGWSSIDNWITNFSKELVRLIYQNYIIAVLNSITEYSQQQELSFFLPPEEYTVCCDMSDLAAESPTASPLMWSATTLVMPKGMLANKWVDDARRDDEKDVISVEGAELNINWGNDVYELTGKGTCNLDDVWIGFVTAHFYYALFDIINNNLTTFVGQTFSECSNKEIHKAGMLLENVINSINILKLDYQDGVQSIRELSRIVFNKLMFEEWDIDNMIQACDTKRKLCESNLTRLNHTINTRNSGRVQIVLTLLAALGIVNLMVSVSSTARTLEMYNLLERSNSPFPSIMEVALELSPDAMAWIGCILGLIAGLIIMANRPR